MAASGVGLFAEAARLMPLFTEYQNKTKRQIPLLIPHADRGGEITAAVYAVSRALAVS
jgi:hypothetical protein